MLTTVERLGWATQGLAASSSTSGNITHPRMSVPSSMFSLLRPACRRLPAREPVALGGRNSGQVELELRGHIIRGQGWWSYDHRALSRNYAGILSEPGGSGENGAVGRSSRLCWERAQTAGDQDVGADGLRLEGVEAEYVCQSGNAFAGDWCRGVVTTNEHGADEDAHLIHFAAIQKTSQHLTATLDEQVGHLPPPQFVQQRKHTPDLIAAARVGIPPRLAAAGGDGADQFPDREQPGAVSGGRFAPAANGAVNAGACREPSAPSSGGRSTASGRWG